MVRWKEVALDRLADIYVAAPTSTERDSIARRVERINAQLAAHPWGLGEDRGPHRRVWFTPPLMVVYDLPPGGGVVVIHVAKLKGHFPDSDD